MSGLFSAQIGLTPIGHLAPCCDSLSPVVVAKRPASSRTPASLDQYDPKTVRRLVKTTIFGSKSSGSFKLDARMKIISGIDEFSE